MANEIDEPIGTFVVAGESGGTSMRITRKELIARANKWGLDVETHSPGGSGTYYTFGEPDAFNPRTMSRTHTEHGLAAADSFLDGYIFAKRVQS